MRPNKLVLDFKDFSVYPKEPGLYFVCFRVDKDDKFVAYDWGFCEWNGERWLELESEVGGTRVMRWCQLPPATMVVM